MAPVASVRTDCVPRSATGVAGKWVVAPFATASFSVRSMSSVLRYTFQALSALASPMSPMPPAVGIPSRENMK